MLTKVVYLSKKQSSPKIGILCTTTIIKSLLTTKFQKKYDLPTDRMTNRLTK